MGAHGGLIRLAFIGASGFGYRCFERLLANDYVQVVGLITAPRRFRVSSPTHEITNAWHDQFVVTAQKKGVPVSVLSQDMGDPHLLASVQDWKPSAFLIVGWYHMIPKAWRALAPCFGLHASLLPDYCGWAPLVWAMINGETKTGITLFQMDGGVDSGPIAAQAEERIKPDDTIETLYHRIEDLGLRLLDEALPKLASGSLRLTPQPKEGRRVMPRRFPEDGWINWHWESPYIENWIRAQTRPYPGAFSIFQGSRLIIWKATALNRRRSFFGEPGTILRTTGEGYEVLCGKGALRLVEVSWGETVYSSEKLSDLFKDGGQCLGISNAK